MAHLRKRHLSATITKTATYSPIIGVLGHRQTGKTTLVSHLSSHYKTFDDQDEISLAATDPKEYIKNLANHKKLPSVIDECQMVPGIFPSLKNWVRLHPKPGQFILTGSVRFTSLEEITESLTGRIINLELYPMILSELQERMLPNSVKQSLEKTSLEFLNKSLHLSSSELNIRIKLIKEYFIQGGLPGVCFIRNSALRSKKYDQQLFTMLDRDLRKVVKTKISYPILRNLLSALARAQGEAIEFQQLQKETQISVPTLKKLIYGLQAVFLIRTIPVEGGRKGEILFFEDQGECSFLRKNHEINLTQNLTHFAFLHFRAQFDYELDEPTQIFQYHTRGGAFVPLVFQNSKGTLGVIAINEFKNHQDYIQSANSLLKSYPNAKVIMIHLGKEQKLIQPRVMVCPIAALV